MAIETLKQTERQKFLALVFFILLFLTALVVFFGIFRKKEALVVPIVISPVQLEEIKINFEVLKNPALKELQIFEGISLPEERGRENPFLPY